MGDVENVYRAIAEKTASIPVAVLADVSRYIPSYRAANFLPSSDVISRLSRSHLFPTVVSTTMNQE
jgi:hypothetical protein